MTATRAQGFFDPQVNGYAGVDFQQDHVTEADLLRATAGWGGDGGGRLLLTLITDAWPRLVTRLRHLRHLRDGSPALRARITGWHLEGPFLSPVPGFHGAHDPTLMRDPRPEDFAELRDAVGPEAPLLVTLAPERSGALEAIAAARRLGIRISLGHTDAPAGILREAVAAGATGFTHLGNGCPQQLDRHDNIVWRVLDTPGLTIGLIADGTHVAPTLFRLIHRLVPAERLYYTTDAMAAAGAAPGQFTIGRLTVEVGPDGVVRQPGRTNFAGSALRANQVVERAARMLEPLGLPDLASRIAAQGAAWLGMQTLGTPLVGASR